MLMEEMCNLCAYITDVINSTHMADGVTVTSLSASLQHKTSVATFCLYHIALNQKLLPFVHAKSH
jgi:hypothetical protein